MGKQWKQVRLYFSGLQNHCSHEIRRCLLFGRKVMTNLDSILKGRDITLPTKIRLVKWGGHHQPACQHPAEHRAAQQAARQHPPGQRGAAQPRREGGECGPWPQPAAPGLVCTHRQSRRPVLSPRGPVTFCSVDHSYISSVPQYLREREHRFPVRFSTLILDLSVRGDCEWRESRFPVL